MRTLIYVLIGLLPVLSACESSTGAVPTSDIFMCDQGRQFVAHFDPGKERAAVFFEDLSSTLERVPDTDPPNYTDGAITLYMTGLESGYLEHDDVPLYINCQALGSGPDQSNMPSRDKAAL